MKVSKLRLVVLLKMPKKKSVHVEIEAKVIEWAIDSSGWAREDILKKLKISQSTFNGWLTKQIKPTIQELEELSKLVKRPLAVFFLSEPPKEKPLPKDYRMLPDKEGKFDKVTLLAIRKARNLQRLSRELSENLSTLIKTAIPTAKINENPIKIAEKYRTEFNISATPFKNPNELFNFLRETIEDRNVLVFQFPMPVQDARGFSLVDEEPSVIVVNSKDSIEARIFTLAHEFGHVILKESEIGMPENSLFFKTQNNVEKWCNEFASSFLLPEQLAREEFSSNKDVILETVTLNKLSRKFRVSKFMIIYNMYKLGFISRLQYDSVLQRPQKVEDKPKGKKGGFAQSSDKKCLSERGQKFVSLVTTNIEKGFITHSDALEYLSVKTKNFDKVIGRAKK
ncbi:MAG: ImmA/IrrE family metallo-endopeptidase [archaeon]